MAFRWNRGYMTAFLASGVVLLLGIYGIISPKQTFSEKENRFLAKRPEFSWKTLTDGSFEDTYEEYLSDQFPMREKFVAAKTAYERLMLRQDGNGVYFGRDGYYIEMVEPEELFTEQLEKNLLYLKDAAELWSGKLEEGRVHVMLIPSAAQILKDKLPFLASPADQLAVEQSLANQLAEVVLPVEESFRGHEKEQLYYRTDHHWTTLGAYYAYRMFVKSAGFSPKALEEFDRVTVTENFFGTIESKVNAPMGPDSIELFLPKEDTSFQVFYDGGKTPADTLYSEKALVGKDKYAVFLDGNHGLTKILNRKKQGDEERRLLIVKDSYAHCFAPFAALHFDEVYMVDLRYFNGKLSELMERENITDVLALYQIPGFAKDKNLFKIVR